MLFIQIMNEFLILCYRISQLNGHIVLILSQKPNLILKVVLELMERSLKLTLVLLSMPHNLLMILLLKRQDGQHL